MPNITLPDGSVKKFDGPVSGLELAESIGPGLAKAALAWEVGGLQKDLSYKAEENSNVRIFTAKDKEGLEIIRHSTAHVLAQAVKELYPAAQITIGPVIESGFYYDISFEENISSEELTRIEARMKEIIKTGAPVKRHVWERTEAIKHFKGIDEHYKAEIISDLPKDEEVSIYEQGTGKHAFSDLCKGPHVPDLGKLPTAFKLTHLAGAYWRGDSDNEMLTRIYGACFATEKELKAYLFMMEEAKKRDHRKLGKELDLFHLQDEAPGQIFWHDKGWTLFLEMQQYIRAKLRAGGYQEVNTPQLVHKELYQKSGHWDKFGTENMFIVEESDERVYAMKPMNCPCHVQIFNQGNKSYRDLPLRMSEFGTCMRNEAHGALHGLMRVTSMTQDDAHIFCTEEQIEGEVIILCALIKEIYAELGFHDVFILLATRPEQRVGGDDVWDMAEKGLKSACDTAGIPTEITPGEGAFYGPKLEFHLRDAIGRSWQCGTVQLDFNLPVRLDAEYAAEDGAKKHCIMIHRALLGSMERFIGILIENYAGHFPLWLSPVQVVVTGISEKQNAYAQNVCAALETAGIRAETDLRDEKISYKIRDHMHKKVPVVFVTGEKEKENGTVTMRRLGSNAQETFALDDIIARLKEEISTKALPPGFGAAQEEAAA